MGGRGKTKLYPCNRPSTSSSKQLSSGASPGWLNTSWKVRRAQVPALVSQRATGLNEIQKRWQLASTNVADRQYKYSK